MNEFPELTQPLCEDDYDWLSENAPQYINAVQASLAKKNEPDHIYHFYMSVSPNRQAFWVRVKHAAIALKEGWR